MYTFMNGSKEMAKTLYEANVNTKEEKDKSNCTPLMYAKTAEQRELLIDAEDNKHKTPLMYAVDNRNKEMAKTFYEAIANIEEKDKKISKKGKELRTQIMREQASKDRK